MKKSFLLALAAGLSLSLTAMADTDPWLWLEQVEGANALAWAQGQNERSLNAIKAHPQFEPVPDRALEILTSDERIDYPSLLDGEVYDFWRDDRHVRGIWRKTSLESYSTGRPDWDVIIDLDELADREGRNWGWAGASCRHPDYDRCIVSLSIGGADAAVSREFGLSTREFVEDGCALDVSKSALSSRDLDRAFVGPAFQEGDVTDSGYPRTVRLWRRGRDLSMAATVL